MERKVIGMAKAFSTNHGWWAILLSTENEGEIWIAPGTKTDQPCPAIKGQIVEAMIQGRYNQVLPGTLKATNRFVEDSAPVSRPQKQNGFKPKTNVGQMVGHATNGAFDLVGYKASIAKLVEAGKLVYDTTIALKKEYAAMYPELSDYDVGASVGQAVRTAANIVREKKKDHSELKQVALGVLEKLQSTFKEYIEEQIEISSKPKEEVAAVEEEISMEEVPEAESKPENKVEQVKEEPKEETKEVHADTSAEDSKEDSNKSLPSDDFDDDIPW